MFLKLRTWKGFGAVVLASVSAIVLSSCAPTGAYGPGRGNKYRYVFKMLAPIQNNNLLFQDESIIIQFKFDDAAVKFQLQNVTAAACTIDWSKATLGVNGRFFPVRHADNLYKDSATATTSIPIPSLGYIQDLVIPRDNILYEGDRWGEIDLLPTTDNGSESARKSILQSVGKSIAVVMPLRFGNTVRNYEFDFQVASVERIFWKDFTPVKRIPAPPERPPQNQSLDQVTTAILALGILGFAAYLITIKKNPPTE
ncbi:MAG: hypothetical protein WBD36_05540 [Bacteroidota bacterium]